MNKTVSILFITLVSILIYNRISNKSQELLDFEKWKQLYGLNFNANEQQYRRVIFNQNLEEILKHNADPKQSYKMGVNQFTIFTQEEFKLIFLADIEIFTKHDFKMNGVIIDRTLAQDKSAGVVIDWTTKGAVSRVKDQGQCGSFWAFSATGVLQSLALINHQFLQFSEQQLMDCTITYGNRGCSGGLPLSALKYVKDQGISAQSQYPYKGKMGNCQKIGGQFKISSISTASGCPGLSASIALRPLSVFVDASNWANYKSGIFSSCSNSINHAVLLVGQVENGIWKIKNSWGLTWGQKGFIRLSSGNTCGICLNGALYPR